MNYYVESMYHCCRVLFNRFRNPYCSKWDKLLTEVIANYEVCTIEESRHNEKTLTILFTYKEVAYTVWVGNGFYAAGYLYKLNEKDVKDSLQRRPSFTNQYRLLKMVEDFNNTKLKGELNTFEMELYKEEDHEF